MTNSPDDQIDPYESRLTRRVGAFAEQAVRPIDPVAIARAAHAAEHRRLIGRLFGSNAAMARLGVALAGALVAVVAFGVYINGGAGPEPTPTNAEASSDTVALSDCAPGNLSGEIVAWEGAAGHRIATVRLTAIDSPRCLVAKFLKPALVDQGGHALIVGVQPQTADSIAFSAGDHALTLVDMSNYCGAAPTGALLLRLYLPSTGAVEARPGASVSQPVDAPPCSGENAPATIQIQALVLQPYGQ